MKKIPTLFERDWNGDRSRVIDKVHPGCEWVLAGEGAATQKIDGTCCMIRGGKLYKRRELRVNDVPPIGFEQIDADPETSKIVGWVPVGEMPRDRWHREAFDRLKKFCSTFDEPMRDMTYELVGPKIQANPERIGEHCLIAHDRTHRHVNVPTAFDALRLWLSGKNIEGIVWHHPDGRMAKIKMRDFGLWRQ